MKALGINGSPRIGGNTDILLDKVLDGVRSRGAQTRKIVLNTLRFSPCQECAELRDDGACIVKDDMRVVYEAVEKADAVIVASPIFFGSLSAQTKMFIDRFQCFWRAKYILKIKTSGKKKAGAFISVEASTRKDFFENAKAIVKNLFATIDTDYKEELFCPGVNEKANILKHPEFLKKAFELGERIASG